MQANRLVVAAAGNGILTHNRPSGSNFTSMRSIESAQAREAETDASVPDRSQNELERAKLHSSLTFREAARRFRNGRSCVCPRGRSDR